MEETDFVRTCSTHGGNSFVRTWSTHGGNRLCQDMEHTWREQTLSGHGAHMEETDFVRTWSTHGGNRLCQNMEHTWRKQTLSEHGAHMEETDFGENALKKRPCGRTMLQCEKDVRQILLTRAVARL
jgi:hypothetical protein